jgi:IS5 family transposase
MHQPGFFDLPEHLKRLSEAGDPLEAMAVAIDFEAFRPVLDAALGYTDGSKGGRPPYYPVTMFKALIVQAQNTVTDARMEFLIRDRLSWLRFLGFELGKPTPDANTIRMFRERLTEANAIKMLFDAFDRQLRDSGYPAMGGQLMDATLVHAPRQRNTAEEKGAIKAGCPAAEIWPDKPAKARQKDVDARWTVKTGRARESVDGKPLPVLAIPVFGYKNHVVIDRRYGFVRGFKATDAARHDGAVLREIVSRDNTASDVWADTAYRSKKNEAWLKSIGRVSRIHHRKPKGRPMPERMATANAAKSRVRAHVEHVFAQQKDRMGLVIRTVGLKRAEAKIGLANLAYNLQRYLFHERRAAQAA